MAKHFLIVKFSSFGDIVNALPAVEHLKRCFPSSTITWVVKKNYAALLEDCPFVDRIVAYNEDGIRGLIEVVRTVRRLGVDTVVDLQGVLRSALVGYLSGAQERVCFPHTREGSRLFYTRIAGIERGSAHAVLENLSVVEALAGRKVEGRPSFNISVADEERLKAERLLNGACGKGAIVVVSPTSRWKTKMWDGRKFAILCDMIVDEYSATVVFTGVEADRAYIEKIQSMMRQCSINLAGKTDVATLKGVLKGASLVISCDSGTMHLASALGSPVVAIFGPTDPHYTGPFAERSVVVAKKVECAPCRRRHCADMSCMEQVSPEDVMDAIRRLVKTYGHIL